LFIKSQFITDAQNILQLHPYTHGHVWLWDIRIFSNVPALLRMVWQASKVSWVKCVFVFNLSWRHQGFKCFHRQTSKRTEVERTWGLHLETLWRQTVIYSLFFILVWGTHSWNLSNNFRYAVYTVCALFLCYSHFFHFCFYYQHQWYYHWRSRYLLSSCAGSLRYNCRPNIQL